MVCNVLPRPCETEHSLFLLKLYVDGAELKQDAFTRNANHLICQNTVDTILI